ncbi:MULTISPECIES: DUF4143 domain-containing protein [Thiorhodovibrio]|uniref:DUF4143 domain-containing protein n=1 Tax=Thiorhodovibrio TaxID=61593 RepID=UPI001911A5D8|nr:MULTISPECIES: DUF4143 domain-containing protein [Thiorhodovibrio]WPL10835.1 hypothetical protein Thiosp_00553 [Thiorhodovibrio litoralis]
MEPELKRLTAQFPALILVGPRQVGKTALLSRTFPDHRYATLDAREPLVKHHADWAQFLWRGGFPALWAGTQKPCLIASAGIRAIWPLNFTDTGLAAYLLGFAAAETLLAGREAGALWENHVVTQWLRSRDWHQPSANLWYWRDQAGNEVDLLIERNGALHAIECKLTEQPGPRETRGLAKLRAFYGDQIATRAWIACTTRQRHEIAPGVDATPGWEIRRSVQQAPRALPPWVPTWAAARY